MNRVFRKLKSRKASGTDGISTVCLKVCADQLAFIYTQIFNRFLELFEVPCCFKCTTIIPIPKITGLNDCRPVALTSVVMKSLERLFLAYLKDVIRPFLDPLQFAYRANRSVDDAVNMGLHYILQHLDKPGNYARILFVDFSSAFNAIMPDLVSDKLTQLSVPTSTCQWIISFLTDRQQLMRLGKLTSMTLTISTGAPHGCSGVSQSFQNGMPQRHGRGSAPQEQPWVGGFKPSGLKADTTVLLSLFSSSLFNVLARGRPGSFGRAGPSP